jgi:uncharacterized membrane protein
MKAIVFALLAGLCWGVGEVFTKKVLASGFIGPMGVLVVRTALALPPAIIAFVFATRVLRSETPTPWDAPTNILLMLTLGSALAAGFLGVLFFYLGLSSGEISVVKPIAFAFAPALAATLGWLILGEGMGARKAAGIGLMLAGLVLVTTAPHGHGPRAPGGSAPAGGGPPEADAGGSAGGAGESAPR